MIQETIVERWANSAQRGH